MSDAERLRRLQLVTDAALAHLDLDELLAELLARTRDALGSDTAAILMLDEATDELVARAALGIEEEVEQGVRIPVGGGFAGKIAAEKRPVVLDTVDHDHVLNPILLEKGIRSMLGVPLLVQGAAIGVLHVGTLVPRAFDADDVELLQLVGDRVAMAIEHARAFSSERAGRRQLERLQMVADAALAHLDLEELFPELLVRIRDALEAETCAFLLLDESTNELVARAALGIEEEIGVRIPYGKGFAGTIAAERRPIFLPEVDERVVVNPILWQKGIKSMLGAPLLVGEKVIGVVHVGTLSPRVFTERDTQLLQLAAERAAMGIEKARLHDDLVRLDQLKLNFVAVASHELRTPATAVYGVAATLRELGDRLTPELRDELERTLWEQSQRLRRLLEQLLDLSRLDARAIEVSPRHIAVRPIVEDIVAGMGDRQPAEVVLDVDPALVAEADPLVLERVLANLLDNAARYGAAPVHVHAVQRDRHLRLSVEDSGTGVPPELAVRLFERFERGLEGSGAGLGLAIAKAYAIAHGGDLVYDPGTRGARFELVIPPKS